MLIRLTRAVKALIIACFIVFVIQQTADQYFGAHLLSILGLTPVSWISQYRLWQLLTYSFLHADVMHLFFNLMMLAFIGGELEQYWGSSRFLRYYFLCVIGSAIFYLLLGVFIGGGINAPMIGASGAIYGLLIAYGLIFGERILLFMMLFPMKAKHFVWVLASIEFMSTVFSGRGGLASVAHLGGMASGFSYLWGRSAWVVWRRRREGKQALSQKERRRKAAEHLRLIINNDRADSDQDKNPKIWH